MELFTGKVLWRIPSIGQAPTETLLQPSALILGAHGLQASLTSPLFIPRVTLTSALLVVITPELLETKDSAEKLNFSDVLQKPVSPLAPGCLCGHPERAGGAH